MGEQSLHDDTSAAPRPAIQRLSFGVLEVDLNAGELRKRGVKIKLHRQPFEVLRMLLERPGEVVTREVLQQKLWPSDTFVDFEHGLNKAINKVREALGDDADNPRYVETLPRRGYRFIGPVAQPFPVQSLEKVEGNEAVPPGSTAARLWTIGLGSAVIAGFVVAWFLWLRPPLPPPRVLRYTQITADGKEKSRPCAEGFSRVVTDGTRVYFSEWKFPVMQVSSSGGEDVTLSVPFDCFSIFGISPDGTELLGGRSKFRDEPLWVLSTVSGLKHPVGNLSGHAATWSPDGQSVAYVTGGIFDQGANEIHTAKRDGTAARRVARIEPGAIYGVTWSPDGQLLRFDVWRENSIAIWEVSTNGSNLHRLALTPVRNQTSPLGSWTSDQKYFVFAADTDSGGSAILASREARSFFRKSSSKPVQLTSGTMDFSQPAPSPDGKRIFAIGSVERGELLRFDSKQHKLEPYLSGISAEHLDFSRDGNWVTYVTYPDAILWRSRVDGSQKTQLTTPPLHAYSPRWSPDGTQIAFTAQLLGQLLKIYVVPAEGGQPKVVSEGDEHQAYPTWAADGQSLIFGTSFFSSHPLIRSVDLRTGHVSVIPGSEGMYGPLLSPDGRFIVAIDTHTNHKLLLFDQHTQKWDELVTLAAPGLAPLGLSSDNRYLYFTTNNDRFRARLHRLRISDRKLEQLAVVEVPEGMTGIWGPSVALTPDGSPVVLRDLSVQEIYALDVDLP